MQLLISFMRFRSWQIIYFLCTSTSLIYFHSCLILAWIISFLPWHISFAWTISTFERLLFHMMSLRTLSIILRLRWSLILLSALYFHIWHVLFCYVLLKTFKSSKIITCLSSRDSISLVFFWLSDLAWSHQCQHRR